MDFVPFPKLPRLARKCIISEKIDGTNAQVAIALAGDDVTERPLGAIALVERAGGRYVVYAGSRTRWVTPNADNFGFASWVYENVDELIDGLGVGHHFGEWWGKGIQRNYGIQEKRFSLFNAERWQSSRPSCCSCVPVLYRGPFSTEAVETTLEILRVHGSYAAPFDKPEGVVVFHAASNSMFKKTLINDDEPKGKASTP